jgi:hypothetical protein
MIDGRRAGRPSWFRFFNCLVQRGVRARAQALGDLLVHKATVMNLAVRTALSMAMTLTLIPPRVRVLGSPKGGARGNCDRSSSG